jgi:hypothetical protein
LKTLRDAIFLVIFFSWIICADQPIKCRVKLCITSDFSAKPIRPQIASLDGKDIRKHLFKPGKYTLEIQHPGYYPLSRTIIIPQKTSFSIQEKLVAKPRKVYFEFDNTAISTRVKEIVHLPNGRVFSFQETFKPGSELKLKFVFERYQTVTGNYIVPPGEGLYFIRIHLNKLSAYEFLLRSKEIELDGVTYSYDFYADLQPIEKHLIHFEKERCKIWVLPESKQLRIYRGYFYSDYPIHPFMRVIGVWRNIDISRLILHLNHVARISSKGRLSSLNTLDNILKNFRNRWMLKSQPMEELHHLMEVVASWKSQLDPSEYSRLQKNLTILRRLKQR